MSPTEYKVTVDLAAGAHDLEIRYFENAGQQSLKFEWKGPDSDGLREVVSGTSLSHDGPIHAGDPGPCPDDGGAVCQCGCGTDDDGTITEPIRAEARGRPIPAMTMAPTRARIPERGTGTDTGGHDHEVEVLLPLPKTAAEADAYVAKVKAMARCPLPIPTTPRWLPSTASFWISCRAPRPRMWRSPMATGSTPIPGTKAAFPAPMPRC